MWWWLDLEARPRQARCRFTVDNAAYGASLTLQTGGFFGTQAQASILITGLTAGTHTIGASYDGTNDPNFLSVPTGASFSSEVTVGANSKTGTTTTIAPNTTPATIGANGTFAVDGESSGCDRDCEPMGCGGTAEQSSTDPRRWRNNSDCVAASGERVALCRLFGRRNICGFGERADNIYSGSGSAPGDLSGPASTDLTHQASLKASVTGNPANTALMFPTGFVEFWDSLNGGTSQLLTVQSLTAGAGILACMDCERNLVAGTHSLKVHYRGDNNWMAADSPSITLTAAAISRSGFRPIR